MKGRCGTQTAYAAGCEVCVFILPFWSRTVAQRANDGASAPMKTVRPTRLANCQRPAALRTQRSVKSAMPDGAAAGRGSGPVPENTRTVGPDRGAGVSRGGDEEGARGVSRRATAGAHRLFALPEELADGGAAGQGQGAECQHAVLGEQCVDSRSQIVRAQPVRGAELLQRDDDGRIGSPSSRGSVRKRSTRSSRVGRGCQPVTLF